MAELKAGMRVWIVRYDKVQSVSIAAANASSVAVLLDGNFSSFEPSDVFASAEDAWLELATREKKRAGEARKRQNEAAEEFIKHSDASHAALRHASSIIRS